MKKFGLIIMAVAFACGLTALGKPTIVWEPPKEIAHGAYGRIRQLRDGRFACVYELGGNAFIKFAKDPLGAWSKEQLVASRFMATKDGDSAFVYLANPEIVQLKSGRLLYGVNLRVVKQRYDLHPSAIGVAVSDDAGATWQPLKIVYRAPVLADEVRRGCWEPYFLELPDGTVQLYFANESAYVDSLRKYQDITVMDSRDGLDWHHRRVACYAPKCRDGMPVAVIDGKDIVLAIESNPPHHHLFPQLVRTPVAAPWKRPVGTPSPDRCEPLADGADFKIMKAGAPYIIKTATKLVLSWQQGVPTPKDTQGFRTAHLAVAERGAFGDDTFVGDFTPPGFEGKQMVWNSLCPLDGDSFLLVSQSQVHIWATKGTIK